MIKKREMASITINLPVEVKEALAERAREEDRSMSNMAMLFVLNGMCVTQREAEKDIRVLRGSNLDVNRLIGIAIGSELPPDGSYLGKTVNADRFEEIEKEQVG